VERTLKSVYKKGETLGSGSFGMVSKGVSRSDPNKIVAIKEVDRRKFEKDHMDILTKTLER
jgi:serine/threonine protein kinase